MSSSPDQQNDPSKQQTSLMFRDEALSYISAPHDMNKLVILTRPYTWLLVFVFFLLTGIAITWSIKGRIPITLQGQGILIPKGGVFESITAPDGVNIIQEMRIHPGDFVKKDEVIAVLDNPELKRNVQDRRQYIATLKDKIASVRKEAETSIETKLENYKKQLEVMERGIDEKNSQQKTLELYLEKKKAFLAKGYATLPDILNLENQINNIKQETRRVREQILQLEQEEVTHKESWKQRERELSLKLIDEERDFSNLIAKLETNENVKSPMDGTVLTVHKTVGDRVLVNDLIVTLSKGDEIKNENTSDTHSTNKISRDMATENKSTKNEAEIGRAHV